MIMVSENLLLAISTWSTFSYAIITGIGLVYTIWSDIASKRERELEVARVVRWHQAIITEQRKTTEAVRLLAGAVAEASPARDARLERLERLVRVHMLRDSLHHAEQMAALQQRPTANGRRNPAL